MLEKGMKVKVWCDPITRSDFEGVATLMKFVSEDFVESYEVWEVRFKGEKRWVTRRVMFGDVVGGKKETL